MKAKRVNEYEVRAIPEPEFTRSWHPISHEKVIDSLDYSLIGKGINVKNREYSLTKDGKNMFASWTLDQGSVGKDWVVGFRNSVDMKFAVGFAAGTHVVVCSNMMFSGEFITFRKHTNGLDLDELHHLTGLAVDQIAPRMEKLDMWQDNLKQFPIEHSEFKHLTYDAMDQDVFPPSKFKAFLAGYNEEVNLNRYSYQQPTLHDFHGAGTRVIRNSSLFNVANTSAKLNKFCDDYVIEMKRAA